VLTLIGAGCSQAQIAQRLVLSEATVRAHLGKLRRKLGTRGRTELALAAREAGLGYPDRCTSVSSERPNPGSARLQRGRP